MRRSLANLLSLCYHFTHIEIRAAPHAYAVENAMSLVSSRPFSFVNPGVFRDRELRVVLTTTHLPNGMGIEVPTYCFMLAVDGENSAAGHVHLRIGNTENILQYQGHIGYGVEKLWRGHHYAERATRLILPLAKQHGIDPVWITCDPDNLPSKRTCERLGGELVEIVTVPKDALAYRYGARKKCRYRVDL